MDIQGTQKTNSRKTSFVQSIQNFSKLFSMSSENDIT